MNKKALIVIIVCAIILVAMLIGIIVAETKNARKDTDNPNVTTESQISADGDSVVADTTESDVQDTDTTSDTDDEADTKPSDDEPDGTKTTTGDDKSTDTTVPGTTTIPPENVDMGVVEGEEGSGIDDEDVQNTTPPQNTEPKDPEQTTPPTQNTDPKDPEQTTPPTQDGNSNHGNSVLGKDFDITKLTYEGFNALNGEQQRAVIDLFGSPEDFMVWYKAMEAIYKAEHPDIEIGGDGNVNFGG